jgi:hypothetical protein
VIQPNVDGDNDAPSEIQALMDSLEAKEIKIYALCTWAFSIYCLLVISYDMYRFMFLTFYHDLVQI